MSDHCRAGWVESQRTEWQEVDEVVEVLRAEADPSVFRTECEIPTAHLLEDDDGEDCIQLWWSDGEPIIELSLKDALELAARIFAVIRSA